VINNILEIFCASIFRAGEIQTASTCLTRTLREHFLMKFHIEDPYESTSLNLIFMDPCIVDYSVEIPTRCGFVIEFIIPKFIEGSTCFEQHTTQHQEL
jgi:hypothetical protein